MTAGRSATSRSERARATTSWFTNSAARTTSLPSIPPAPVTRIFTPLGISGLSGGRAPGRYRLEDLDLGVVADHEAVGARHRGAALDRHVLADEARLDAALDVLY